LEKRRAAQGAVEIPIWGRVSATHNIINSEGFDQAAATIQQNQIKLGGCEQKFELNLSY
jgi:hypothetical protein